MGGFQTIISFDMRAPDIGAPAPELYAAALDMASFADRIGIQRVGLMEHHGSEDGYLPSPFVMGAAVAARTERIRISLGAVILPLHDPVKIAEQIGVLDQIAGGRLEVIFGAGYVQEEFDRFRRSLQTRGRKLDEGIAIILRALDGEQFDDEGREVFVRPLPIQDPRDILMVGGGVKASAIRAARYGLGFVPVAKKLFALYEEQCREHGFAPRYRRGPSRPGAIHLAEDVDRGWEALLPHAAHVARAYAAWATGEGTQLSPYRGLDTVEAMRASGIFVVWTPEQLLEHAAKIGPYDALCFQPLLGGLAPEEGWRSLHLLETVMPELEALRAQA